MEKISFKEILFKSLELLKMDKKRFGAILFALVGMGVLAEMFRDNPILSTGMGILNITMFIAMSIMTIFIVKNFIEKGELIENEVLKKKTIKYLSKSIGLMLIEGVIIVLALLVFLLPLAVVLVIVAPKLSGNIGLMTYFIAILFAIPLIIVNVMISFSLQFFLIKKLSIGDSIKSSYSLVKNNFKRAMIIGIKINFFYYASVLIVYRVNILGAIIISGLGILYILMTTFTYYKLTEKNEIYYEV